MDATIIIDHKTYYISSAVEAPAIPTPKVVDSKRPDEAYLFVLIRKILLENVIIC